MEGRRVPDVTGLDVIDVDKQHGVGLLHLADRTAGSGRDLDLDPIAVQYHVRLCRRVSGLPDVLPATATVRQSTLACIWHRNRTEE